MSTYRCFFIKHTSKVRRSLLVIDMASDCDAAPGKVCRAERQDGEYVATVGEDGLPEWIDIPQPPYGDAVWPGQCDRCHRVFIGEVMYSTTQELVYKAEDGSEMTISTAPFGAMWSEPGFGMHSKPGPDGLCLVIKTPGGNWCVDGPSWENGVMKRERAWTRTGTVPNITANPSIHILTSNLDGSERKTVYHGWLRDGVLVDA